MLTREVPGIRVGYGVIVPTVLAIAGIVLLLGRLALARAAGAECHRR
jgi:hypothetical protein